MLVIDRMELDLVTSFVVDCSLVVGRMVLDLVTFVGIQVERIQVERMHFKHMLVVHIKDTVMELYFPSYSLNHQVGIRLFFPQQQFLQQLLHEILQNHHLQHSCIIQ